jgi:beta-galactosidase
MKITRTALVGMMAAYALAATWVRGASPDPRQTVSLDDQWKFHLGDFPLPANTGIPVTGWQWKATNPATMAELNGLKGSEQAGDWQKGIPATADLPAGTDEGPWQTVDVKDQLPPDHLVWFRLVLPACAGIPPYMYLHNRPPGPATLIYFNGKLVTPNIYRRSNFSFSFPLEGWRPQGPNVLMMMLKKPTFDLGEALLISPAAARGILGDKVEEGPAAASFDDTGWQTVAVPHDYVIEGTYDPSGDAGHAYLPVEPAWYRRTLQIPATDQGKRLWLEFDGVYDNCFLWINGRFVDLHYSGYNSFHYDISNLINYGQPNEIALRVDPRQAMGWWYEGGGILRHVRLVKVDPVHVAPWGVQVVSTVADTSDGKVADAMVNIVTTVESSDTSDTAIELAAEIVDASGNVLQEAKKSSNVPAGGTIDVKQSLALPKASLWSPDHPALYTLRTTVRRGEMVVDQVPTTFGVRQIRWDAEKGFILNGIPTKLKGTCNHGDFIGVGTALPDRIQTWRIQKLKEMGSNAYRSAHNPPAPELLDACDRQGMLVLDENRFLGDSPEVLGELENMIRRDRNHPSVILWSISNEERAQEAELGAFQARAMVAVAHKLDDRMVTAAMNIGWGKGETGAIDVQGFNYGPNHYDEFHQKFPQMPVVATEIASTQTTRGIYADDLALGYVSAYNTRKAPPEYAWGAVASRPFVAGGFVWTGFEYKGEPSPHGWPCVNSNYGIMDNCGFPKDDYWYYKAWWSDVPLVHVGGHWNWSGKEGQGIAVQVYSNCDEVELFLNGRSQGSQKMPPYGCLKWTVPYEPGILEAKAIRGTETVFDKIETTGAPSAIQLIPDRTIVAADGKDVSILEARIVDDNGKIVPTAANPLSFSVDGPATILGVGNGDPSSHEPDKASKRLAFNGLAMVLVQTGTQPAALLIRASSAGLKPGEASVQQTNP